MQLCSALVRRISRKTLKEACAVSSPGSPLSVQSTRGDLTLICGQFSTGFGISCSTLCYIRCVEGHPDSSAIASQAIHCCYISFTFTQPCLDATQALILLF